MINHYYFSFYIGVTNTDEFSFVPIFNMHYFMQEKAKYLNVK